MNSPVFLRLDIAASIAVNCFLYLFSNVSPKLSISSNSNLKSAIFSLNSISFFARSPEAAKIFPVYFVNFSTKLSP